MLHTNTARRNGFTLFAPFGKVRAYCKTPTRHVCYGFMSQFSWKMCFLLGNWATDLLFACLCVRVLPLGLRQLLKFKWRLPGRDSGIPPEEWRRNGDLIRMFLSPSSRRWHCWPRSRAKLWWQVPVVALALPFPPCEIMSFNKPDRSYKPSHSSQRAGSADLQRKVDCSAVMKTGLVLNPIIK